MHPKHENQPFQAYLIGGGIGSLAAAAFMVRDGGVPGRCITILEAASVMGGSLDGAGHPDHGYSLRGGRMLTTDNYECTWGLFRSIPSLEHAGQTVFDETVAFNALHQANAMARLIDCRRAKVPVHAMGFSLQDRLELLQLSRADEAELGARCITDCLSPSFFETEFWFLWSTTFAFQPWHSAVEFRRYLHRFLLEFSRIETLAGVKRTVYNQYDSLVLPLQRWLETQGVRLVADCTVTDIDHHDRDGVFTVTGLHCQHAGRCERILVQPDDLVFLQNGSMTDASSLGSMTAAPAKRTKADSVSWTLWERLARDRPAFGNPAAFNQCIAQSYWESFTVTLTDPRFFDAMQRFTGNEAGTGGRAGVLGLRAVPGPDRQLRGQADGRLQWRRDPARAVRAPALRSGDGRLGELHSLPHALPDQHVHAAPARRPAAAGATGLEELRLHQPVRRGAGGRGLHGRVFGAGGADGRLPAAGDRPADSASDPA